MGLDENKALVRRYYDEVLTGRDRELLEHLVDPSFVSHISLFGCSSGCAVARLGRNRSELTCTKE
jgi:hypothetical protein